MDQTKRDELAKLLEIAAKELRAGFVLSSFITVSEVARVLKRPENVQVDAGKFEQAVKACLNTPPLKLKDIPKKRPKRVSNSHGPKTNS